MSAQIQQKRKRYYDILEKTQKGDLDITEWLEWFLYCLDGALEAIQTRPLQTPRFETFKIWLNKVF
ncbi:hypothetical protein [Dyadobacter alkalitolerans]|uniref:hypothetical protein n=1 Tax=Dyadobacter alkalitolerans TaxID=492736 RepID=UPI0004026018|nr:hypothetical protein [Dyadobacter alkalitolerans]